MRNGTFRMNGVLSPASDATRDLMSTNNPFLEENAPWLADGYYMIYIFEPDEKSLFELYQSKNPDCLVYHSKDSGHTAIAVLESVAYQQHL